MIGNKKSSSTVRDESSISILNELLPTLDCIFSEGHDKVIPPKNVQNLINTYKNKIKDENVLCYDLTGSDRVLRECPVDRLINYNVRERLHTPINEVITKHHFEICNRQFVENFSRKIQFVTAAAIHDKTHIVLLNNLKPNPFYQRGTLSYVQGHVSYDISEQFLPLIRIFVHNMIRELNEEIGTINNSEDAMYNELDIPSSVIYLPVAPSTIKHCCILYDVEIPDTSVLYCKESDKNSLIRLRIDQLHTQYNYLCPWVLQSLKEFNFVKSAYLKYLEGQGF